MRKLARLAGTSHATLLAYESGKKIPSVTTFLRILDACGYAVNFELERRIREADGIDRGEELAAVLELASRFPSRLPRQMNSPVFGQHQPPGNRFGQE